MTYLKAVHELVRLRATLREISHHIGGQWTQPDSIVEAAESARAALNRLKGYQDIPRDTDGRTQPYSVVGR